MVTTSFCPCRQSRAFVCIYCSRDQIIENQINNVDNWDSKGKPSNSISGNEKFEIYITQNGEKSPDYLHPETAELTIRDGVLKVNSDGNWTTYVMTNSGDIVMTGSSFLVYFSRVDQ